MSVVDSLYTMIERGRKHETQILPIGMPKLERYIDGVTQETYYLVAGSSGSGKTSFVLYSFLYRPLMQNISKEDFLIIYFSLEMSKEQLMGKLLSLYLFETYGIEISFKELVSKAKDFELDDETMELINSARKVMKEFEEHMVIIDDMLTPQTLMENLDAILLKYGVYEDNTYTLNNPNMIIEVVLDHIGLVRGGDAKQTIDAASSVLREYRNRCRISPVVVMQVNRGSSSMERRKGGCSELEMQDLKGSGNPSEDSNIVLALFYPFREKMSSYRGYDIKQIGQNMRSVVCLKNRFGEADFAVACGFWGKTGMFDELPKANEIYSYDKYQSPNYLLDKKENEKDEQEEDINKKNTSNFNFIL